MHCCLWLLGFDVVCWFTCWLVCAMADLSGFVYYLRVVVYYSWCFFVIAVVVDFDCLIVAIVLLIVLLRLFLW